MGTSQMIEESYKNLKEALCKLLHSQKISFTDSLKGNHPFIVLETPTDSIGFFIVNGSPQDVFQPAYNGFKLCYRQNHSDWQHKNLSFVLCRLQRNKKDDGFFSSVETDAYFCRKYVIEMHFDQNELCTELSRLPFLPIPDTGISGISLPPSAQTLLQDINVSAAVARQIVVPMEYSASNIFKNLVRDPEKLPELNISKTPLESEALQPTESTRVKKIRIEAFRAYKNPTTFNLDADIVILYGPNGLGKTSFFDAIDYACTGRIGRFCRNRISPKRFISLSRHLSADKGSGIVDLKISRDKSEFNLKRHVDNWRYVHVDNEKYDRANLLKFITSARWGDKKPRIERIERLFRATHLFNQTDSELFTGFLSDSILSSDLVSRMFALDDYTSGKSKINQIQKICKKQTSELNRLITSINDDINQAKLKLEKIPKPSSSDQEFTEIKTLASNFINDLDNTIKKSFNKNNVSIEYIKECRSITDAELREKQALLGKIENLIDTFGIFNASSEALKQNKTALVLSEKKYSEVKSELELIGKRINEKENKLQKDRLSLTASNKKILNIEKFPDLQTSVKATRSALKSWENRLKESEKAFQSLLDDVHLLISEKNDLILHSNSLESKIEALNNRINLLEETLNEVPKIEQDQSDIKKLKMRIAADKNDLISISNKIKENDRLCQEKSELLDAKKNELERLNVEQSKLTSLLDEIECYALNSLCPTCGFDYGSKNNLIEKIRNQKVSRPIYVENFVKECNALDVSLKETIKFNENNKDQKNSLTKKIRTSEDEVSIAENRIHKFNKKIEALSIDTEIADLTVRIKKSLEDTIKEINRTKNKFNDLKNRLKTIGEKQKVYEKNQNHHESEIKRANTESAKLYDKLNNYMKQAEEFGWNIDIDHAELDKSKSSYEENIVSLSNSIRRHESDINKLEKEKIEIENSLKALKNEIDSAQHNIDQNKTNVRKFLDEYSTCTESNTPELNNLNKMKIDAEVKVRKLNKLKDRAIFLELAFDSAEKSALIVELDTLIQKKENEKNENSNQLQRIKSVQNWIFKIGNVLDKQSSIAVDNYVESFGPLTTIIQKRLRAVYGFSDVYLKAKGDEIQVNVDWAENNIQSAEAIRPTDYFSDSQKQILMLSLFLSGRLTQNWSGFAPILLDDPVTHFDDLNAFGFVELIRGLVSRSPGKRQFFISTCDNRLFDLMRSKLGGKNTHTLFYRFNGIDTDGPIVEKA